MTTSWIPSQGLTYEAGDTPVIASVGVTWTTVPAICNIQYRVTISPDPVDPDLIFVDDQQLNDQNPGINIKVGTNRVFYQVDQQTVKYTPGTYTVEVRAWGDNDYDTGSSQQLQVEIIDPCFEMMGPSSEYLPEQTYFIGSGQHEYSVQIIAENAFRPVKNLCGGVTFEAELYEVIVESYSGDGTPQTISSEKFIDISQQSGNKSYLEFNANGLFRVETSDLTE